MTTPTNYVLRQTLKNITNNNSNRISSNTGNNINPTIEEETIITLNTKKFKKIADYGNEIICNDGTRAKILQPMPCMKWTPKTTPDQSGNVTLTDTLEATILSIGEENVVLGFTGVYTGVSTELELLIDLGDTELIMNNEYYSVKAKHHAKDGVEI